ncbi:MAG: hypothetical protein ABMA01_13330 [Chthoniobacteraceae bacterium]
MKPIVFHVEAAGEFRPVNLTFATEPEVRHLRVWRRLASATDAGEFAALAAKRWLYYAREGAAVASLGELSAAIRRNDHAEAAFLMVASAEWARRYKYLALAFCRRTWCHHFVVDFLAVRPGASFASHPIHGLGSGVIYGMVKIAESLGIEKIWGEATASSAPFYEKVLQVRHVEDSFAIRRDAMRRFRGRYIARLKGQLAKHDFFTHYC